MIKILNLTFKRTFPFLNHKCNFSSAADPYYILGVDKTADFKIIKMSFFKLANQYHPDKNDTPDAKKKFILVKQAFEQIKMQKGLMKPQNFVDTTFHDSVRPNANQFTPDEEEGFKSTRDYRIFREKATSDQRFSQFNSSFQTVHDINDIKIKVEEGQMKDASQRFNLQSQRAKITVRSQSSLTVVIIGMAGIFLILAMLNEAYASSERNIQTQKIVSSSQLIKEKQINSQRQIREKSKAERQRKIKYEQLMKIISETQQKSSSTGKNLSNKATAWANLVEDSKQDFMTSNQNVI